ncbi:RluA family pseudouridine synthase [Ornithinibacillus bavariensis]|uniref:Pseudouridine synthase n=1 Tax=Ornithinibacillus bavariensis TaxID=545502 RepID=A0A919X4X8_9BACI|nr:RluA family pseudouridine synthase [Ornithinibacillus bavariensis]GIO25774.1 pseudouridine synthase [Ornithinibacillus bavariensis]HAM79820.1 RNA pseudouridine synthase [Ornithinibacillus sp.]
MKWTFEKENVMILRDFLREEQGFSRRILKSIISDGGEILVNGKSATLRYKLKHGDRITVKFPDEKKGNHMLPDDIPIQIVYEDDFVLVLDKPAGMATIPSLHHQTGTIANAVLFHYAKQGLPYTVHVVTRLDRDTSGLLLIAKHRYSHSKLSIGQKQGRVKRKYIAIVEGVPKPTKGVIHANIGRKADSIIERTVREDGQSAITNYEVVKDDGQYALVAIQLETGRTHQIRVHFSYIGYPLAGDDLYGGSLDKINRQALHSCELQFEHPETKEWLAFTSEIPDDMKKILSS